MSKKKDKTLVVVESPGKVKKIQEYLGDSYIVRASFGHVRDLAKSNGLSIDIEKGFKPKYRLLEDKMDKVQSIIDAASQCNQIYLATDPDREGEAIAWHLLFCLESCGKPIRRVKFNEITKTAILKSVSAPEELDKNLFDAQQARRVLDRIVGFLSSDYLKNFGPNLSAGRVQSVAAKLIIDKEDEIKSFIPDEFWNITSKVGINGSFFDVKFISKITNETDAQKIKNILDNGIFSVESISSFKKIKEPQPPFTTSTLQQVASNKLGMKVATAMRLAQSLYESGMITYMRTDSVRSSKESLDMARNWLSGNNYSIPNSPKLYGTSSTSQDAHEAIRPTDVNLHPDKAFLNDDEVKLYRLIWERFIASQMDSAIYDVSDVIVNADNEKLKVTGKILKYEGFLKLYSFDNKDNDLILPDLKVGDKLDYCGTKINQNFTKPPSRYNEASLVKELENKTIGRPSTYATIVDTVKQRSYVVLNGKNYEATELGDKIIKKLSENFSFMNYNYTAKMEKQLDLIAEGKLTYLEMLTEFFDKFKKECKKAQYAEITDYGISCPKCGEKTVLNHGKFGFFMMCIDKNNCKGTVSVDMINNLPVVRSVQKKIEPGYNCPDCNSGMQKFQGKYGPFLACETYPKCRGKRKIPYGRSCIKCGNDLYLTLFQGVGKLACMGYPSCKNIEDIPADPEFFDPKLVEKTKTSTQVKKILRQRKEKNINE